MGKVRFTPELQALYKHPQWLYVIRPAVLKRDNYTCQVCKKQILRGTKALHCQVDHLVYLPRTATLKDHLSQPISQMQTICNKCHKKKTAKERKARKEL